MVFALVYGGYTAVSVDTIQLIDSRRSIVILKWVDGWWLLHVVPTKNTNRVPIIAGQKIPPTTEILGITAIGGRNGAAVVVVQNQTTGIYKTNNRGRSFLPRSAREKMKKSATRKNKKTKREKKKKVVQFSFVFLFFSFDFLQTNEHSNF